MTQRSQTAELTALLVKLYPHRDPAMSRHDALSLVRRAMALHRWYETACNRGLTPSEERRTDYIEAQVRASAKRIGLTDKFNRDPRGYPVKLLGLGTHNTWGGPENGYGIG